MSDQPSETPKAAPEGKAAGDRRKKLVGAGMAVGIGSAAIVAALLYAKGSRRTSE